MHRVVGQLLVSLHTAGFMECAPLLFSNGSWDAQQVQSQNESTLIESTLRSVRNGYRVRVCRGHSSVQTAFGFLQ